MEKTFEQYYEEVISTLEEVLECTTSDAQGIAMPYEDIIHNAYQAKRPAQEIAETIDSRSRPKQETGHTPGPWKVNKKVKTSIEQEKAGQGMNIICECQDPDGERTTEEDKANARLIAAAPDMLEALKELYKQCNMVHKHWGEGSNQKEADAAIEAGKKAIAKATQAN